jgi:hypothetical protein
MTPCYATIQAAVDAAGDGDEIRVAQGTYIGSETSVVDIIGKSVDLLGGWDDSFTARDPDVYLSTVDGEDTRRCFYLSASGSLIDGFEVTRGRRPSYPDERGGGFSINNSLSTVIQNNYIHHNHVRGYGGGIYLAGSDGTIVQDNRIVENSSSYYGGGMVIYNSCSDVIVRRNVFDGNSGGSPGGGIWNDSVPTLIENNLFIHNHSGGGGGIACQYGAPIIQFNTLAENSQDHHGGAGIWGIGVSSSLTIRNNIITENTGGHGIYIFSGQPDIDFNDVWNNSGGDYGGGSGSIVPGPHDISADPQFVGSGDHPYGLQSGSPCIDAGTGTGAPDHDRAGRLRPQQGGYDLGAYEADTTPPTHPTVMTETHGVQDGVWQKTVDAPQFQWWGADDDFSGVAGYSVYFGSDPNGTSAAFVTEDGFDPPAVGGGDAYYLRLNAQDNAGNTAGWETLFTFRYDDTLPLFNSVEVTPTVPSAVCQTSAPELTFSWNTGDHHSGVAHVTEVSASGTLTFSAVASHTVSFGSSISDTIYYTVTDNVGWETPASWGSGHGFSICYVDPSDPGAGTPSAPTLPPGGAWQSTSPTITVSGGGLVFGLDYLDRYEYEVWWQDPSGGFQLVDSGTLTPGDDFVPTWTLPGVYRFRVRAVSRLWDGTEVESEWTEEEVRVGLHYFPILFKNWP